MKLEKKHIYIATGVVSLGIVLLLIRSRVKNKIDMSIFDSPDKPGSGECMDQELIQMLKKLAKKTGYPIFDWVNSGARSRYWNKKVGGVRNSAHLIPVCKAVDIKVKTRKIRKDLVMAAKEIGFKRIGIANSFIHLDIDETKPQYAVWGYGGKRPPFNPFV